MTTDASEIKDEDFVVHVKAQVMTRDDSKGGWVPLGGGGMSLIGLCRLVTVVRDKTNVEFLIYGHRMADKSVVLKCTLKRDLQYTRANPTFHHWKTEAGRFGLTFQSSTDARVFEKGVRKAVDSLGQGPLERTVRALKGDDPSIFKSLNLPLDRRDSISRPESTASTTVSTPSAQSPTSPTAPPPPLPLQSQPPPHAVFVVVPSSSDASVTSSPTPTSRSRSPADAIKLYGGGCGGEGTEGRNADEDMIVDENFKTKIDDNMGQKPTTTMMITTSSSSILRNDNKPARYFTFPAISSRTTTAAPPRNNTSNAPSASSCQPAPPRGTVTASDQRSCVSLPDPVTLRKNEINHQESWRTADRDRNRKRNSKQTINGTGNRNGSGGNDPYVEFAKDTIEFEYSYPQLDSRSKLSTTFRSYDFGVGLMKTGGPPILVPPGVASAPVFISKPSSGCLHQQPLPPQQRDCDLRTAAELDKPTRHLLSRRLKCIHCQEMFVTEENRGGGCVDAPDPVADCIDRLACTCCARALLYHCMACGACADAGGHDPHDAHHRHPCACDATDKDGCKRWTALSFLSVLVPCLWCYWPLTICHRCAVRCGCCGGRHEAAAAAAAT